MPAETARLARPVGRRDRMAVAILLCACALAAAGTARAQGGSPPPGRGCVQADVAGVLGGGTVRGCGRGAFEVCRVYGEASAGLAAQCARLLRAVSSSAPRAGRTPPSAVPADAPLWAMIRPSIANGWVSRPVPSGFRRLWASRLSGASTSQ